MAAYDNPYYSGNDVAGQTGGIGGALADIFKAMPSPLAMAQMQQQAQTAAAQRDLLAQQANYQKAQADALGQKTPAEIAELIARTGASNAQSSMFGHQAGLYDAQGRNADAEAQLTGTKNNQLQDSYNNIEGAVNGNNQGAIAKAALGSGQLSAASSVGQMAYANQSDNLTPDQIARHIAAAGHPITPDQSIDLGGQQSARDFDILKAQSSTYGRTYAADEATRRLREKQRIDALMPVMKQIDSQAAQAPGIAMQLNNLESAFNDSSAGADANIKNQLLALGNVSGLLSDDQKKELAANETAAKTAASLVQMMAMGQKGSLTGNVIGLDSKTVPQLITSPQGRAQILAEMRQKLVDLPSQQKKAMTDFYAANGNYVNGETGQDFTSGFKVPTMAEVPKVGPQTPAAGAAPSGVLATAAAASTASPAAAPAPATQPAAASMSKEDVRQSIVNARVAIKDHPELKQAILAKMQQAGIDTSGV